jgi:hypothetical protein
MPNQIATYMKQYENVTLSNEQVRQVMHKNVSEKRLCESQELELYMHSINGLSAVLEKPSGDETFRLAILTFTPTELANLAKYGDVVSIDPTFVPMFLNWSIIPLTVVGPGRNLHSGGLALAASSSAEVFNWILTFLVHDLPCKDKIRTIISDDDVALNAAFENSQDIRILSLGRILCVWHKMNKFLLLVNNAYHDKEMRERKMALFRKMASTRDEVECGMCIDEIMQDAPRSVAEFMNVSIIPKLAYCTKSHAKNTWSLGYISSSISESANSGIKRQIYSHGSHTLLEIRQMVANLEEQRNVNRRCLKARKPHADYSGCGRLIRQFHIDRRIAEALAGSIAKSERLRYVQLSDAFEVIEENFFGGESRFITSLDGTTCSCGKLATVGLPCSHIFLILSQINGMEKLKDLIHKRWVLDDEEYCIAQTERILLRLETLPKDLLTADMTVRQRFAASLASSQEASSVACRTQDTYEEYMAMLKRFVDDHMKPVGPKQSSVRDLAGIRPGRKPLKRAQQTPVRPAVKQCAICGHLHSELKCPHLNEVKAFVEESRQAQPVAQVGVVPTSGKGSRHCSICGENDHYAPKCKAIQKYRDQFNMVPSDDDTPPMPEDPDDGQPDTPGSSDHGQVNRNRKRHETSQSTDDIGDDPDYTHHTDDEEESRTVSDCEPREEEDTVDTWELCKKTILAKNAIHRESMQSQKISDDEAFPPLPKLLPRRSMDEKMTDETSDD